MENVLKLIEKNVLIPLELTPATLATDAAIHKKKCLILTLVLQT